MVQRRKRSRSRCLGKLGSLPDTVQVDRREPLVDQYRFPFRISGYKPRSDRSRADRHRLPEQVVEGVWVRAQERVRGVELPQVESRNAG